MILLSRIVASVVQGTVQDAGDQMWVGHASKASFSDPDPPLPFHFSPCWGNGGNPATVRCQP